MLSVLRSRRKATCVLLCALGLYSLQAILPATSTADESTLHNELDSESVRSLIIERAEVHGANAKTMLCVAQKESRFKPSARGRAGEYGVYQWLPPVERNAWGATSAYQEQGISIAEEYHANNTDAPYYDIDAAAELFAKPRIYRQTHWPNTLRGCE